MHVLSVGRLVVLGGDIALLLKVLWSDLCDVHINQIGVVSVDLHHLVRILSINVNVVAWADMLMGQDNLRLTILVSWRLHVCNLKVTSLLLLIDLKEEILLGNDLIIGTLGQFFSLDLFLKLDKANLLLHHLVNPLANLLQVLRASCLTERLVSARHGRILFQGVKIGFL